MKFFVLLLLIASSCFGFDKNLLKKGKRDSTEKHPISRRVLRFERSVVDDFTDFPYPMMDFAKVLPDLPGKIKSIGMTSEYSDIDF